jgi:hypothetical protein
MIMVEMPARMAAKLFSFRPPIGIKSKAPCRLQSLLMKQFARDEGPRCTEID